MFGQFDSCVVFPAVHQTKPIHVGSQEDTAIRLAVAKFPIYLFWLSLWQQFSIGRLDWAFVFLDAHFLRPLCVCVVSPLRTCNYRKSFADLGLRRSNVVDLREIGANAG